MKRYALLLMASLLALASCEKEATNTDPSPLPTSAAHAFVLNQGAQGKNNASLSRLDLASGTLENNWFAHAQGEPLGDLAQDLVVYGTKAYVTMFSSGCLWAIDTATGLGTRLDLGDRGPRYIAPHGGKLYITCYRPQPSVIAIDTATLAIEATCPLGTDNPFYPEGIAYAAGRLFVASSWGNPSNPTYDTLLYIVDPTSMQVDTALSISVNPQFVVALPSDKVVVNSWGAWDPITWEQYGQATTLVDARTLQMQRLDFLCTNLSASGATLYAYSRSYSSDASSYFTFSAAAPTPSPILTSCAATTPAAIAHNPLSDDIYLALDNNGTTKGDLQCYAPDGTLRWQREIGYYPTKIVVY